MYSAGVQKGYGTWPSPISAEAVATQGLRLGGVAVDGDDVYWLEGRPNEGGRNVLIRTGADGRRSEVTPPGFNVRTRVQEYGGGAFVLANRAIYFSNFSDQRIYGVGLRTNGALDAPRAITPPGDWFYADAAFDAVRQRLICVREDHGGARREPETTLVSIPLDGTESAGEVIASGFDFYSTPRLSSDGSMLAWLSWRHPQMPWDGTELWIADVASSGRLEHERRVAGGPAESIYQPGWSPDGALYFVSDRDGWWKLYRSRRAESSDVVAVIESPPDRAEFGRPAWVLGSATWACAGPARLVVAYTQHGRWFLGIVDVATGELSSLVEDLEPHDWLAATPTHVVAVAGTARKADAVVRIELSSRRVETLQSSSTLTLADDQVSLPQAIEFPSGGRTAHAFVYLPRNGSEHAPPGERPPLIVIGHGGPTTATKTTLNPSVQYWTSRGFAVADVNYGGSSGYGREYRQRLNTQWGIVDVEDSINAARYLVRTGQADPDRLIIRGGSAGGYTTLAALTFHPGEFKAGASYYGISDVEVLAHDTHKFESRYLDTLIGPYPVERDRYLERSPIHFVDRLSCALILFQGLEDKIVPPNQSEMMANAVRQKGLPVAYLTFEGEQHGFRKASTIVRCLEAELFFYGVVFGFQPKDRIEPVHVDNLHL
jgi:dipeptidyl aminopeptidase/acylaminoacyl peptidase